MFTVMCTDESSRAWSKQRIVRTECECGQGLSPSGVFLLPYPTSAPLISSSSFL